MKKYMELTHWDWVTYLCISKLTIIGSDNALLPGRHQAIIWTNGRVLLIGTLKTHFNEILSEIHIFKKIHLKMSDLNVLSIILDHIIMKLDGDTVH